MPCLLPIVANTRDRNSLCDSSPCGICLGLTPISHNFNIKSRAWPLHVALVKPTYRGPEQTGTKLFEQSQRAKKSGNGDLRCVKPPDHEIHMFALQTQAGSANISQRVQPSRNCVGGTDLVIDRSEN